jgi:hypothetical protein
MALSEEDELRIEATMRALIADLRYRPNQEKEDRLGVEVARMPEEERAFVPTALLRQLVHEREGRTFDDDEALVQRAPLRRRRRFGWF